jgi:hypothetical protein
MKKQIIILILIIIYLQSWSQKIITTTTAKCDDKLYMTIPGRWKTDHDYPGSPGFSRTEQQEAFKRLDAIQALVFEAYPEPIGLDAVWHRNQLANGFWAQQIKYSRNPDGSISADDLKGISTGKYEYRSLYFRYLCSSSSNGPKREVVPDAETATWLIVEINPTMAGIGTGSTQDSMRINGLPVYRRTPAVEQWKGHDFFYEPGGTRNSGAVMIYRQGAQPHLPVTRKQYLDYCFPWLDKFYDEMIRVTLAEMPVRSKEEQDATKNKWLNKIDQDYKNNPTKKEAARKNYLDSYKTDEQMRDEKKDLFIKQKAETLKLYEKELEKTTREGLLDSPAIIHDWHPLTAEVPIFMTEAEGGGMLVTFNPAYWRKDLPKYVPQFIWMHWNCQPIAATQNLKKRIEEYFPIEKLQAMIDK